MILNSIYDDMPDNSEEAFLYLENHYREVFEEGARNDRERADYLTAVIAAASALGIEDVATMVPPTGSIADNLWDEYQSTLQVAKIRLQIKLARRRKEISVAFEPAAKQLLRDKLDEIRGIVDRLVISEDKRDALYKRIKELAAEIDSNRLRRDTIGALIVDWSRTTGRAYKHLKKPIEDMVKLATGGAASPPRLPPPQLRLPKPDHDAALPDRSSGDQP